MSIRILSSEDVDAIVRDISPKKLIDLMREVFTALSSKSDDNIQSPHRTTVTTPHHSTLFMPSRFQSDTAIKIVSIPSRPSSTGLPASTIVMDDASGSVKAIINARSLTALRTAAGSALATTLCLPVDAKPENLCFFGAGLQIAMHAKMFLHPEMYGGTVRTVYIVNRSQERMETLLAELRTTFPKVQFTGIISSTEDVQRAVAVADIICTATSSTVPLFESAWVKEGAHLNLVGSYTPEMREVENALIVHRASVILVDSREACRKEAGELIGAGDGIDGKIVEVGAAGNRDHGNKRGDVTIFKSVGIGAQDAAIAAIVIKLAEERQIGSLVAFE